MKAHWGSGIRQYLILIAASLAVTISCARSKPGSSAVRRSGPSCRTKPAAAPQAGTSEEFTVSFQERG